MRNIRGFWKQSESGYVEPKVSAVDRKRRQWVRQQMNILRKLKQFSGASTNSIYAAVAHAAGLEAMPTSWSERFAVFQAYLGTGKKLVRPPRFVGRSGFYMSDAWRRLRYRALMIHGKRCAACGAESGEFHVDHIKPRSKFPELELSLENLQVLCKDCNLGKGAWDMTDWRGI